MSPGTASSSTSTPTACTCASTSPGRAGCGGTTPCLPPRRSPARARCALRVSLTGGAGFDLTEAGTRKSLAAYLVHDPSEVPGIARLGPDPLAPGFGRDDFAALLKGERRQLKGALRDQSLIAGIGNAYSDEILHVARMSPFKAVAHLTEDETTTLYEAMRTTLTEAVERSHGLAAGRLKAEKKSGLRVHGRTGQPCPVCGDTVREVSFADLPPVLRHLPDRRQGPRRPTPVEAAQATVPGRAKPGSPG
ncbi:Formamidopyrimidine-DNA glycosylase [Streptomyces griseus]